MPPTPMPARARMVARWSRRKRSWRPAAVGRGDQARAPTRRPLAAVAAVGSPPSAYHVDARGCTAAQDPGRALGHALARAHERDAVAEASAREDRYSSRSRRRRRAPRRDSPRRRSARTSRPVRHDSAADSSSAAKSGSRRARMRISGLRVTTSGRPVRRRFAQVDQRAHRGAPCRRRQRGNRGRARASERHRRDS